MIRFNRDEQQEVASSQSSEAEQAVAQAFAKREALRAQAFERSEGIHYFGKHSLREVHTVADDVSEIPRIPVKGQFEVDMDDSIQDQLTKRVNRYAGSENSLEYLQEKQLGLEVLPTSRDEVYADDPSFLLARFRNPVR